MNTMNLLIMSPQSQEKIEINWLEVATPVGTIVIQPGHTSTILSLLPEHEIHYQARDGKEKKLLIHSGFAHITPQQATILMHA